MPSSESSDRGNAAARAAARKFPRLTLTGSSEWYDAIAQNGTRYSIKSAQHTRASGQPGKFRFWRKNHERLAQGRSAVILVLTASESDRVLKVEKVSTATVDDAIRGRWFPSGHADDMGEQYRVPWPDILHYR